MSSKFALIIGNTEYTDQGLAQLTAPGRDAEDFARVLSAKELCAFDDVSVLLNQPSFAINEAIEDFFDQRKPDDLLVLYFSGHGVRDELGILYLAVKNTNRFRLRSTAIKSDFIREAMDQSRSKRQVLILDCCNSGAFAQGTKAATGVSIGTSSAFESGFGRIILTASDSTQFAWEGDQVIGETDNSLFTHYLVEGLKGDADNDGDGRITVDELYDYAYEKVRRATPKQTPSKFSTKQQGEIVLRHSTRIEDIKPIPLPEDLIAAAKSSLPYVREAAVRQLDELLKGKNLGLARSARETLEHIAENDDSKTIARAAFQALEAIQQAEQVAPQKGEEERSVAEAQEKRKAEQMAETKRILDERTKEAERLEKEKTEELILKIKNAQSSKSDIWYWMASLIGFAGFLGQAYSEIAYGDEWLNLNNVGQGMYEVIIDYMVLDFIFVIGAAIQAWILYKRQHYYGFAWITITLVIPFVWYVISQYSFFGLTLLGGYTLIGLIPAWVIVTLLLIFKNYNNHSKRLS